MHRLGFLCSLSVLLLGLFGCASLSDKINDAVLVNDVTSQQLTLLCVGLTPKRLLALVGPGGHGKELIVYELARGAFSATPQPTVSLSGGAFVSSKWPKLWSVVKGKSVVAAVTLVDSLAEYLLVVFKVSPTTRSAVLFNLDSNTLVPGFGASAIPSLSLSSSSTDALISTLSAGVFYERKVSSGRASAVYQVYSFPPGNLGGRSSAHAGTGYSLCHHPGNNSFTRKDSCPVDGQARWTVWCGFANETHFFLLGPEVVIFAKENGKGSDGSLVHVVTLKLASFLTTDSLKRSADLDAFHKKHVAVVGISLLVLIGIVLLVLGVWYYRREKHRRTGHRSRHGSHQSGASTRSGSVRTKGSGQYNRSGQSIKGSHQTGVKGSHSHAVAGSMALKATGASGAANLTTARAVKQGGVGASTSRQRKNSGGKTHARRTSTGRKAGGGGVHRRTPTDKKGNKNAGSRRHQRSPKSSKRTGTTNKEKSSKSVNLKAVSTLPTLIIIPAVESKVAIHLPFN